MMSQATIVSGMQTAAAVPADSNSAALASPMDQGFGGELSLALESLAGAEAPAAAQDEASGAQTLPVDAGLQNMPLTAPWLPLMAANFSSAATSLEASGAAAHAATEAALQRAGQALPAVQGPRSAQTALAGLTGEPQTPVTAAPAFMGAAGSAPQQGFAAQALQAGDGQPQAGSPTGAAAQQAQATANASETLVKNTPLTTASTTPLTPLASQVGPAAVPAAVSAGPAPQQAAAGAANTAPQGTAAAAGPSLNTPTTATAVTPTAGAQAVAASAAAPETLTGAGQTALNPEGSGMAATATATNTAPSREAAADASATGAATGAAVGVQPARVDLAKPAAALTQVSGRSDSSGLAPGLPHGDPAAPNPVATPTRAVSAAGGEAASAATVAPRYEPSAVPTAVQASVAGRRSERGAVAAGDGPLDFKMQTGPAQPLGAGLGAAGALPVVPAPALNGNALAGAQAGGLAGMQAGMQAGVQGTTQTATQAGPQALASTVGPTPDSTAAQASLEPVQAGAGPSLAQDGGAPGQTTPGQLAQATADAGAAPSLWSSSPLPGLPSSPSAPAVAAAQAAASAVDVSLPIKPHWVSLDGGAVQVEVLRMAREGGGRVTLELTPPDQGSYRLDLRIDEAGQATLVVEGVSESMRTRLEMGEAALRDQFNQMGLQLNLQMRGEHQLAERDADGQPSQAGPAAGAAAGEDGPAARRPVALDLERGLVRLYA
jgi:hypothetical protein